QLFFPVRKNIFNTLSDKKLMGNSAQNGERHHIMNSILQLHTSFIFNQAMLMMPKSKWSETLFINEILSFLNMRDFSNPFHINFKKGFNSIENDHAFIHIPWKFLHWFHGHMIRRYI